MVYRIRRSIPFPGRQLKLFRLIPCKRHSDQGKLSVSREEWLDAARNLAIDYAILKYQAKATNYITARTTVPRLQ